MKTVSLSLLALASTAALAIAACGGSSEADVAATQSTSPTEPGAENGNPNGPGNAPADPGWGSAGPGVAPGVSPAIATACSSLADVVCKRTKSCAPGIFPALYIDEAACVAANAKRCAVDALNPGVTLDANGTNACATAMGALSCEDFIDDRLPGACRPAGTLVAGAACVNGLQCQSGFCAGQSSKASVCGVCAVPTTAGGACVAGTCPSGQTCQKNLCVARKKIGDACKATTECGTGQICAGGKTCAVGGLEGTLCALDADCDVLQGLHCSYASNRCTKLAIVEVGQTCGIVGNGAALCHASDCNAGVCIARVKEGEACSASMRCENGLACVGGKCLGLTAALCK